MTEGRLARSETDRMVAGVCGGIATYLGVDSALVRLAFVVLLFASGIGFPIYLILWVIMPSQSAVTRPGNEVIQENIGEMSTKVSSSVSRVGRSGTVGIVFVLFGSYFLLNQFGWLSWASGILWPAILIGAGIYLVARRNR
jgi:phage shock protein C